jgi:hypothetical protein
MRDFLVDNKLLYNFQYNFLRVFSFILKIAFFLYITGFLSIRPPFLAQINFVIKIIIAVFLIYRLNSHRSHKIIFTELDRKIGHSAGLYILIVSFAEILNHYTELLRNNIIKQKTSLLSYFLTSTNLNFSW